MNNYDAIALADVEAERFYQDQEHGNAAIASSLNGKYIAKHGEHGWLVILLEEVGEVSSEILKENPILLYDEVIQVAAVALAWAADLKRRNPGPLDHRG